MQHPSCASSVVIFILHSCFYVFRNLGNLYRSFQTLILIHHIMVTMQLQLLNHYAWWGQTLSHPSFPGKRRSKNLFKTSRLVFQVWNGITQSLLKVVMIFWLNFIGMILLSVNQNKNMNQKYLNVQTDHIISISMIMLVKLVRQ